MSNTSTTIECPIGLFEPQEARIEALARAINAARTASEKTPHARHLMDEVGVLLACPRYDRANHDCVLCRSFSELRQKTATLIVKIAEAGALH